jgi:hypothetical protein
VRTGCESEAVGDSPKQRVELLVLSILQVRRKAPHRERDLRSADAVHPRDSCGGESLAANRWESRWSGACRHLFLDGIGKRVIRIELSLADALLLRFTVSPLGEVVRLARAMANPKICTHGAHIEWLREERARLLRLHEKHDLRPLLALLAAREDYYPDFLTPTPEAEIGDIDRELQLVRNTERDQVQREIGACLEHADGIDPDIEQQLRSTSAPVLLADLIYALWEAVVQPRWQQLQDLLERDVLYRSRLLARGGLTALFSDLEPLITLRQRTVRQLADGGQPDCRRWWASPDTVGIPLAPRSLRRGGASNADLSIPWRWVALLDGTRRRRDHGEADRFDVRGDTRAGRRGRSHLCPGPQPRPVA